MSQIKTILLGENFSTASSKLRKNILFNLVQQLKLDNCHRCHLLIETVDELSIEHTIAWQKADNPKEAFYDLTKIAFSHLNCNVRAANHKGVRSHRKGKITHGISGYRLGCKCVICKDTYSIARKERYMRNRT